MVPDLLPDRGDFAPDPRAPIIRIENPASAQDRAEIRSVNEAAFGRPDEADLVDALRDGDHAIISVVAELDGRIVAHALFSRMEIATPAGKVPAVALAPVAVFPEHQRKSVGSRLIRHGLRLLRSRGEAIVIVLGHPSYYARFGFSAALTQSLGSPFPPEAFMALELRGGALSGIEGSVVYPPPFGI